MSKPETEESNRQPPDPVCKIAKLLSAASDKFIEKARRIHGDRYDYTKSFYVNAHAKLTITCPVHGDFMQNPNNHLSGKGCSKCGHDHKRFTTEEFIERANNKHGNKYNYDKVVYVQSGCKVKITCHAHGDFEQVPNTHLKGHGCPECAREAKLSTVEEFIAKAKLKHSNIFDYSKVTYIHSQSKVIIICPIHGDFQQIPQSHLNGRGCPTCQSSKNEERLMDIFVKYNIPYIKEFKLRQFNNRYEYDFYLPLPDVIVEFHGDHHYVAKKFYGGESKLKSYQRRDREKEAIAKAAGIPIVVLNTNTAKLKDSEYEQYALACIRTAYQTRQNVYPI